MSPAVNVLTKNLKTFHLKREILDIYQRTSFGGGNFGNTSAMRVSFFRKFSKFNVDVKDAEKIQQNYFVFDINASELFALNCLY